MQPNAQWPKFSAVISAETQFPAIRRARDHPVDQFLECGRQRSNKRPAILDPSRLQAKFARRDDGWNEDDARCTSRLSTVPLGP